MLYGHRKKMFTKTLQKIHRKALMQADIQRMIADLYQQQKQDGYRHDER